MRGPVFKYLTSDNLIGLGSCLSLVASDKNLVGMPSTATLADVYASMGVKDGNAKKEVISYLKYSLGFELSGIKDTDQVSYHRRFGKAITPEQKALKDEVAAYDAAKKLPDYMTQAVARIETDFSTTPRTSLSLGQIFQAVHIDGAGHDKEQANVRDAVFKVMNPADRDKIADFKQKRAGTYPVDKHDTKELSPKYRVWKDKTMAARVENKFKDMYEEKREKTRNAYSGEKFYERFNHIKVNKDFKAVYKAEQKAIAEDKEAKFWADLRAKMFGSASGSASTPAAAVVSTESDYSKIIKKLNPFVEKKAADLSKFGEISTGLNAFIASMPTYGPLLTTYFHHVAKDAATGNVKTGLKEDHTLPTHALLGYRGALPESLIRKAITDMKTRAADPESKKLMAELSKDARASMSRIYTDVFEVLNMNASLSKDPKSEEYTVALKNNPLWKRFTEKYKAAPDVDKPKYEQYWKDVSDKFVSIAKKKDQIVSLLGLLSKEAPMEDAESESLMKELAKGDLSRSIYDFKDPAEYDFLAQDLSDFEGLLQTVIYEQTTVVDPTTHAVLRPGVPDINTNFANADAVRAATRKIEAVLKKPPADLTSWDLGANGILKGGAAITLDDLKSYLTIRDAYLDRDIRAMWALAMLRKKGKIDPI